MSSDERHVSNNFYKDTLCMPQKHTKRKLAKTAPLRVTREQFATISNSRITCTLLVDDPHGKYSPGMLAVVMEFDTQTARFTMRQTLRLITHVWQAMPGYDADMVVLALQPIEECR